jgi:hypothetical protein
LGLLDDAVGALDKVANAGGAGAPVTATPKFFRDEPLIGTHDDKGGAAGPDPDGSGKYNTLDTDIPTEFIHYGLVHADIGKKFLHKKFSPAGAAAPPEGHAIMFRDGLQREAILLHGFVSSCAVVLQEYLKDKGPLGDVGAAVGSLMGGGKTESKPDPTQLDTIISDIKSAADSIKGDSLNYKDIHEAGKKLHQARANFNKFCESLNDYYLKPPSGDGPAGALNSVMSAIPSIPGIGNTMEVVQRFLFKMFDIYLGVYLELRRDQDPQKADDSLRSHERNIERASHWLTIDAIKTNYETYAFTFPIWFKKEPLPEAPAGGGDPDNLLQPVVDKVNEVKDDVEKKVDDVKKDIYDFAGANQEPEATPGTAQMQAIFNILKGSQKKDSAAPPAPPTAADATIKALDTMLKDISGLPTFLNRPIQEVTAANVGLLEEVYLRLMTQGAAAPIDNMLLLEAGRRYLTNMISGLGVGLISGMVPTSFQGLNVQDFISKEMNQFLGKYTEPILLLAIGDLATALEQSRSKAQQEKAQTMEVYLGRLPWLIALMFRNTFFPIWNLIAEKVFGSVAGPLGSVLHGANEKLNAVRDKVDEAKKVQDTASNVADAAKDTHVDASNIDKAADPFEQAKQAADDKAAEREAARKAEADKKEAISDFVDGDQYKKKDASFPVTARIADGQGLKVEEELPSILPA